MQGSIYQGAFSRDYESYHVLYFHPTVVTTCLSLSHLTFYILHHTWYLPTAQWGAPPGCTCLSYHILRPTSTSHILHLTSHILHLTSYMVPAAAQGAPVCPYILHLILADMLRTNTTLVSIRCDAMPFRFAMQLRHAVPNTLVAADSCWQPILLLSPC